MNNIQRHKWITVALGSLSLLLLTGCHTIKTSEPPRTAEEQLLLSTAADRALRHTDFSWLDGKKVFVEDKYFESYDKGYCVSAIRQRVGECGALLVPMNTNADVILEIRSGGLGLNSAETLIGIPSMAIPFPLAGPLQTPELAFYKSDKADAYSKFAVFAYERESGQFVQSAAHIDGNAHFYLFKALFVGWHRTDIPEMKAKKLSDE